jgi:hypothetical protein
LIKRSSTTLVDQLVQNIEMMRKKIRTFYCISFSISGSMGISGEKSKNETQ